MAPAGSWTEAGLEALQKFSMPTEIKKQLQKRYQEWKQGERAGGMSRLREEADLSKNSSVTYDEAQEQVQESIDAFLHDMTPYDFAFRHHGLSCNLGLTTK